MNNFDSELSSHTRRQALIFSFADLPSPLSCPPADSPGRRSGRQSPPPQYRIRSRGRVGRNLR